MAANRLQRHAVIMSGYNYKTKFVNGVDNRNADAFLLVPLNYENIYEEIYLGLIERDIKLIQGLNIKIETQMNSVLK